MLLLARTARWTVSLSSGPTVLVVLSYGALLLSGYRAVAVYSGSMEPALPTGALAIVKPTPASQVKVGDAITFTDPYVPAKLVTHHIVQIVEQPGRPLAYRTKGDANPAVDPWAIELPGSVGRLAFDASYAGHALVYMRTVEVRTALIGLPGTFLLVRMLRWIWRRPARPPLGTPVAAANVDTLALTFGTVQAGGAVADVFRVTNVSAASRTATLALFGPTQIASAVFATSGTAGNVSTVTTLTFLDAK